MPSRSLPDRARRRFRWHVSQPFDRHVAARLRRWRNARRVFRPIFVGGTSGSGTSLLAVSLGQRFDCAAVIYESNFQVAKSSRLYVPHIDSFPSVAAYREHMTPASSWSVEGARRDLLECYRSYAVGPSDVVIDKGPDTNPLRASFLARCFPDARHLLIFRDPVANVEGLRRKWRTFGRDPLEETIRFYADVHESFLAAAAEHPEHFHVVEYEDLVASPDAILEEVGRRLGLRPARRVRRLASSPNVEGQGIRNVQGSRIGYVKDANERARARLAAGDAERIERALGPLQERLRGAPFTIREDVGRRSSA